jgi:hypothetical protein
MVSWKQQTNNLQESWGKFFRLTWQERWILLQAFAFLPLIAVGFYCMNFQRLSSILVRFSPMSGEVCSDAAMQQATAAAHLVQAAASRTPFKITCLVRSTALWFLLRRQGIGSEIRIGVNQQEGKFKAHAWVESNGIVLNDRNDIHNQFAAFEQIILPDGTERI